MEENELDIEDAAVAVRRVLDHPYTTEAGEHARLGTLATLLRWHRVDAVALGRLLGAMLPAPPDTSRETHLGRLLAWVQAQRVARLRDVEREACVNRLVARKGPPRPNDKQKVIPRGMPLTRVALRRKRRGVKD